MYNKSSWNICLLNRLDSPIIFVEHVFEREKDRLEVKPCSKKYKFNSNL